MWLSLVTSLCKPSRLPASGGAPPNLPAQLVPGTSVPKGGQQEHLCLAQPISTASTEQGVGPRGQTLHEFGVSELSTVLLVRPSPARQRGLCLGRKGQLRGCWHPADTAALLGSAYGAVPGVAALVSPAGEGAAPAPHLLPVGTAAGARSHPCPALFFSLLLF